MEVVEWSARLARKQAFREHMEVVEWSARLARKRA